MQIIIKFIKLILLIGFSIFLVNFKIDKQNIYNFMNRSINKIKNIKFNKNKNSNILKNIYYFNNLNLGKNINIKILFIIEVIFIILAAIILFVKTKIFIFSIVLSIFFGSLPIQYVILKNNLFKLNFIRNLNILIINLKNNVKTNNDILYAIKKTSSNKNINFYFKDFIYAVNNGVNVIEAFEYVKEYYKIEEFSNLITVFQNCYIYGGNYYNILKNAEEQLKVKEKLYRKFEKANTEMISTLLVMLVINIYIIFSFILSNKIYIDLYLNTLIGKIIIDINLLILIKIYFVIFNSRKMEELNEN